MTELPCEHPDACPVGSTETLVERADPSVAGMVVRTEVRLCPNCLCLVATVALRPPRGPRAAWTTTTPITLTPEHRVSRARGGER